MSKYLNSPDNDWYKQRLTGVVLGILAAFLILLIRLFYLQVVEGNAYNKLSGNNRIRLQSIESPRGLIFDRNGSPLVDNRPSFELSIIPKDAKPVEKTVNKLSEYSGIPYEDIMAKLKRSKGLMSYNPIPVKNDIGRDSLAAIEVHSFDLPGVVIDVKPTRHYINRKIAAHLLGYLSEISPGELKSGKYPGARGGDFIGKVGVERVFEQYLRGTHGGRQVEVNARGQVVRVLKTVEEKPGHNLFLTIDKSLQKKAEYLLKDVVGAAGVMDVNSGEVLAMASNPTFDQNDFVSGLSNKKWQELKSNPDRPMENKVFQGEYPPASIYKIISAIAGLEEGVIDETTVYPCPGYHRYGNRVYRCWKRGGHGNVDIVKALSESCDVYFYIVGQKLGVDRLAWYAKACGLGTVTGLNLAHEKNGLVPTAAWKKKQIGETWHGGETLSVVIGQGYNLVTPLQMLTLTSAVANGGERYKPLILKSIKTASGEVVVESRKEMLGTLPVSEPSLELIKKGLWDAVNHKEGTGRIARLEKVGISGKTGTAQVVSRKRDKDEEEKEGPRHHKPHAWFVAYAPTKNPEIAVSVIVEHGEHGSSAAGPIARELIRTYIKEEKLKKEQQK